MRNWNTFPRYLLVLSLLIGFCAGTFAPHLSVAEAKPNKLPASNVVISEFRTTGPNGGNDEFIEIYNPTNTPIPLGGLKLRKSSGCGMSPSDIHTFVALNLLPGQYYLVASTNYSGSVTPDITLPTNMGIADNGGIAITNSSDVAIDQVGMCANTTYKEPSDGSGVLSPMTSTDGTNNKSYERMGGGCNDSNNNAVDFSLVNTSNPQNSSIPSVLCLYITNVNSTKPDGLYTSGEVIDIDVTFTNNVNVTGGPVLLLETGETDRNAVYVSGSDGDATITFRYTVSSTDSSSDLDYASTSSLSLNGGSITGAVGDALLDLPAPGATGSLGNNKDIQIDAVGNPSVVSIRRQNPLSTPANADTLVFRCVFSEVIDVSTMDANDFVVTGSTAAITLITSINGYTYDLTVSGGDLAGLSNVEVGLNISPTASIADFTGNIIPTTPEPAVDETYTMDNIAPTVVSINQTASQPDPTSDQPVLFSIVLSEAVLGLTSSDIKQDGTATGVTWYLSSTSDPKIYSLSATASGSGTLIPSIDANRFTDIAGNNNVAFSDGNCGTPEPNNCVDLNVTGSPTVTVNQSPSQVDPTSALPIDFIVKFSEPINTVVFTASDITQNGTATGITWSITNSGDDMTFTLSATSSGYGTIIPSIAANRVTDLDGNNNIASTSTDNTVTFSALNVRSVVINEVAWAGTTSSLPDDEWIELYNTTNATINITGWNLKAADGTPNITLNGVIPAGGYFLLERDDDDAVSDILADQIYTGSLSNTGEALTLYDASNKIIDTANGNGGSWPKGSSTTYGTMERVGTSAESDSTWQTNTGVKKNGKNANGGDILGTPKSSNSPTPTPTSTLEKTLTPTRTPTLYPVTGRPFINEFLPRPGYDWNRDGRVDVFDEFIEIKNHGPVDINLKGWKLDDEDKLGSNPFTLPDVTLKPGERVAFYASQTNILLSDGGDTVRLLHPDGTIFDAYTYALAGIEDKSICRLPDADVFGSWEEDCTPTPNLINTRYGNVPVVRGGKDSPICDLPDTIPADFLFAECRGYGANVWNPFFWDQQGWQGRLYIQENLSKWKTFVE